MAKEDTGRAEEVGLCASCCHARVLSNRRGSEFWRCAMADSDPSMPRYPPLPVLSCRAFSAAESAAREEAGEPGQDLARGSA